jgi:hypothetical protein
MYGVGLVCVAALLLRGYEYYMLPLVERPHSVWHNYLKPGGLWGHGLGIWGSTLMLLLFLYSARKRQLFGLRFGKIRYWLNVHIVFGITGPIFVTLHTAFKVGGIVSISYYSMVAVMLSGFIGRYIYVQIPRALSGEELTLKEMVERRKSIEVILSKKFRLRKSLLDKINALGQGEASGKGFGVLLVILKDDLAGRFKTWALKRELRASAPGLSHEEMQAIFRTIRGKTLLERKMAILSSVQSVFHYWHIVHKPFAYVMIIIMFVHVGVTILFGYRWIF